MIRFTKQPTSTHFERFQSGPFFSFLWLNNIYRWFWCFVTGKWIWSESQNALPNPEPKTQTIQFLRMLMPLKSLLLQKHIVWQWYPRHYISKCCDTEMRKHQASPSRTCEKNTRNRREAMCNGHTNRINLINDIDFSVGNGKQPKNT